MASTLDSTALKAAEAEREREHHGGGNTWWGQVGLQHFLFIRINRDRKGPDTEDTAIDPQAEDVKPGNGNGAEVAALAQKGWEVPPRHCTPGTLPSKWFLR